MTTPQTPTELTSEDLKVLKQDKKTSKFLSLILRHKPHIIGLHLDAEGWADVTELLSAMSDHQRPIDRQTLERVVANNDKQRFSFDTSRQKIRANQGHSFAVDLNLVAAMPPLVLYHGTADSVKGLILQQGLLKQTRQYVHLSTDITTALAVGQRHGKPIVFVIDAQKMHQAGLPFYLSANGVWLTEHVPAQYLQIFTDKQEK